MSWYLEYNRSKFLQNKNSSIFWGKAGSGILFICREDQTALILLRSSYVEQPGTWGIAGGAISGTEGFFNSMKEQKIDFPIEVFWNSAKKEVLEEIGVFPNSHKVEGTTIFQKDSFKYVTFIVSISLEEKNKMESQVKVGWETEETRWVPISSLPQYKNLHFGLQYTVSEYDWK